MFEESVTEAIVPLTTVAPLSGLRIIDLSTYVAGPSATMTLAQLGAEVIRVDPIGGSSDHGRLPLDANESSLYWAGLNKAKRSVEIDTSAEEGRELVGALVKSSGSNGGIILTNAVGQSWLSYESMRAHRRDLIEVHITGRRDGKPAVDYTINCEVGLPDVTGPVGSARPVNHVLPAWDLLTGLHAAIAVLTAERVRRLTGEGQKVSVSLADVAVATMSHLGFVAEVTINGHGRTRDGNYLYGSFGCDFATADKERVMVVALTDRHWRKLVDVVGIADAVASLEDSLQANFDNEADRYRYRSVLESLISPWFSSRPLKEVSGALDSANVLWGPYRSIDKFVNDSTSLLNTTPIMVDVAQPGIGMYPIPRPVLEFSGWADETPSPAPILGQDTEEVLRTLVGLDPSEIADLRARSIIGGPRVG